jgi:nucleoside-diphosphate-sugar epimerase
MRVERIAITGVGGFIGRRMAERARSVGIKVAGLELSAAAAREVQGVCDEIVVGGVNDPQAVARLCRGADVVFHTAAIVAEGGKMEDFRRVNVEGTRTVAHQARAAGVRRLLHLSSVMVYGFSYPPQVSEGGPLCGENDPYCQTKIESEIVALTQDDPDGMRVVILRPGDVYGPRSVPWVTRPISLLQRGLFVLPDGGRGFINPTHVDNLIDGAFLALGEKAAGHAFTITDGVAERASVYFLRLGRMLGLSRIPTLPASLMRAALRAGEGVGALTGWSPPGHPAAVDFLLRPGAYSIAHARNLLGYEPRVHLDEGMEGVHRWLAAEGLLDRSARAKNR